MAGNRRRTATLAKKTAVEEQASEKDGNDEDVVIVVDDNSSLEPEIAQIRRRWELASVLNFLMTFEPVIGSDLKLTAEEIETGLVKPDSSLARLHIKLLKGIPPVSKTLNDTDAWVTAVCKKITIWWPWVAEGEMPLTAAKGEEIYRYKELEPTTRLLILKALCEIRAEQDDAVSYINDALKNGSEISCFRKNKIGGDGNATSYWYDGGTVIGHRLYKEVSKNEPKSKMKGKASNGPPTISLQWETLATNLNEFEKIVDELSSSKVMGETAVGKIIKTDVVPAVQKFQKKKERALKQKERQERLLNDIGSYGTGITRSCRNRRAITYTFDEYDRAIDEAIKISKKRKTTKEIGNNKLSKQGKLGSDGGSDAGMDSKGSHTENSDSDMGTGSKDGNIKKGDSLDSEAESDSIPQDSKGDDNSACNDEDNDRKSDNYEGGSESENSGDMDDASDMNCSHKPFGTQWSIRLAGDMHHPDVETRNLASKNRLRQRPTRNSALDTVVLDSEDDSLSDKANGNESGCEDLSPVADSEEVSDG
ncbi:DDT domain-containing protein DDR4 [Euphorbia lathyris]|uniref:DDT domain-containing protein DDR4 n=1 Tax=Euphorbia lathyris TaxID=212925 RepID=UPI0033140807